MCHCWKLRLESTSELFQQPRKNSRAGKIQFCQERPGELKRYGKNFNMKTKTL